MHGSLFPHPHRVSEFAAPCRGVRDPWGAQCFTPCHCLNRSWARGGAPPKGDGSKLVLGSPVDGAGEHLEVASLEQ